MDNLGLLENRVQANKMVSVLSIPLDIGSDNSDVSKGPKYLLKLGLRSALEFIGYKVNIFPEISASAKSFWRGRGGGNKGRDATIVAIADIATKINSIVKKEIRMGNKVLALGGDHAISIGTVSGAADALKGDLGMIWIDAHGDINTSKTSISQNAHGMCVSVLLGLGDKRLARIVKTKIKSENILYIGVKDLDQAEIDLMRKEKLSVITIPDILEYGFAIVREQVERLNKKVSNIWVSVDMDSVDEQYAPASAMATPGGLSYREVTNFVNYIEKTSHVVGMDITEVTPKKDIDKKTGQLAIELIASAFGAQYNWYRRYIDSYRRR